MRRKAQEPSKTTQGRKKGIEKGPPVKKKTMTNETKEVLEKRPNKVSICSSLPMCTSRNMIPIHRAALLNVGPGAAKKPSTLWYMLLLVIAIQKE